MQKPSSAETDQIQEQLIANGVRWLKMGLESFDDTSKDVELTILYCAISFEIFAKALVFSKQWELIFSEPGDADIQSLKSGSAKTIGFDQAGKRLGSLCQIDCGKEFKKLSKLSRHRNKIVHFFHSELSNSKLREQVSAEIIGGWGALMHLLKRSEFQSLINDRLIEIREIDAKLFPLRDYLASQAELILSAHSSPDELETCPLCRQQTYDLDGCLLCGAYEESHADVMGGVEYVRPADCPECGGSETVFRTSPKGAKCSNEDCFHFFEVFEVCEWCQTSFVSYPDEPEETAPEDRRNTYLTGCEQCGGLVGHLSDKD